MSLHIHLTQIRSLRISYIYCCCCYNYYYLHATLLSIYLFIIVISIDYYLCYHLLLLFIIKYGYKLFETRRQGTLNSQTGNSQLAKYPALLREDAMNQISHIVLAISHLSSSPVSACSCSIFLTGWKIFFVASQAPDFLASR